MKRIVTLLVSLMVALCLPGVPSVSAQTVSLLDAFFDAFNLYNVAAMQELVTEDFELRFTRGSDDDLVVHLEDFQNEVGDTLVKEHSRFELSGVQNEDAKYTFEFAWHFDTIAKLGLGPVVGKGEAVEEDGKLTKVTLIFDPEMIAKFEAAIAGGGEPMPQTGAASDDSWRVGLAGVGALLLLGGVGLRRRLRG